jgi:hypothetical protein
MKGCGVQDCLTSGTRSPAATFEDYAAKYCPNNDPEFFDQLIKSCRFTSS